MVEFSLANFHGFGAPAPMAEGGWEWPCSCGECGVLSEVAGRCPIGDWAAAAAADAQLSFCGVATGEPVAPVGAVPGTELGGFGPVPAPGVASVVHDPKSAADFGRLISWGMDHGVKVCAVAVRGTNG